MNDGPINTCNGWIATPLTKRASRTMDVSVYKDEFYFKEITPIEMNAMEFSCLTEKMVERTGVFLDISETEQALVSAKDVETLIRIVNEEKTGAAGPLLEALEKTADVLERARENHAKAIFWF